MVKGYNTTGVLLDDMEFLWKLRCIVYDWSYQNQNN